MADGSRGVREKRSLWPRNQACDILMKNVAAFCSLPEHLPEAKGKSFRLILLAEEILKQPSIDSVVWLLVITLVKIHGGKEQAEQSKSQNVKFEEKKSTKKWNGAKS